MYKKYRNICFNKKDKEIYNKNENLDYIFSLYDVKKRLNMNVKDFIFYTNYMIGSGGTMKAYYEE